MSLFALPGDHSITLKWDILPEEGKNFAGGYIINIDRSLGTYVTINLSIIEAAKKCYVIDDLNNGTTYLVQYVQLFDDGTQMSTLSKGCTPQAPPDAVQLVDAVATPSEDKFTVTVTIDNPNSPEFCNISFALIQVHEDSQSIADDDPNAVGGVFYCDDILNYNFPVNGNIYVLDNVPRAHYKLQATYIAPFGKSWSNMLDVFAYLNPSNVTVVATSGNNEKLPFTVSALDNALAPIETIRVTVSLNGVIKEIIDLTDGDGWTKVGSNITGSGEFTGLINDTAYKVEAVGITANEPNSIGDDTDNMVSSTVGTTYGVPHNPTNAASTISFTPSNGIDTTGYTITLEDSTITNYFEVVFKDIDDQEVYRATNITANSSTIPSTYLFDGLKIYVTIKDSILSRLTEYWKYPELDGSLYAHTELVSERLNIETKPEPVSQLQLFAHNVISFLAAWDANSQPDYFTITSDSLDSLGDPIVNNTIQLDDQTSGSIFQSSSLNLQEDTEYTLNVVATNSTDSSTKQSITFTYVTAPPVLSSAVVSQVGFDLKVSLLGVLPTTSYWKDGRAVADVYVNDVLVYTEAPVEEKYYVTDLAYDDVVKVIFKHIAFYAFYEPLATRHNTNLAEEYSDELERLVTMTRHPATFSGLTWTQSSDKLGYGNLSWTPPVLETGATVTYVYSLNGASLTAVNLGDPVYVQYLVTNSLTLTATVVYNGATTTHSETIQSFVAQLPELSPTFTYTKIDPGVGVPGDKEVAYSISLNNNYSFVSAKIKYSDTEYDVLAPPLNRFTMSVPSQKSFSFKIIASLTNGDFDPVQKETDWIEESYIWGLPPSITLTSAERINGGSRVTYTVHCNGDYVTGVLVVAVPLVITTTSLAFTRTSFDWSDLFDSAEFSEDFADDLFPNDLANKDDIKITMFALNNSGFGQFEQNFSPGAELPLSVDIVPSLVYNAENSVITIESNWNNMLTRPDNFSYYMFRTSDNVIVLESIAKNTSLVEGSFYLDIASVAVLWAEYTLKVRAQNSAGVSPYKSLTFTYGTPPLKVTGLNVVTVIDEVTSAVTTTASFTPSWTYLTAPDNFYLFVTGSTGIAFRNNILPNTSGDLVSTPITGLVSGRSYIVTLQAQNKAGFSEVTLPSFTYFSGSGAITDLNVINKTMTLNVFWKNNMKPDSVYFHIATNGVDVDYGFIPVNGTSGDLLSEPLDNLVSGTSYTLYAQPFKDSTASSPETSFGPFVYIKGPNPVSVTSVDKNIFYFITTWLDVRPDKFYWYVGDFYGEVANTALVSGETLSASFGNVLSGGTVDGTPYTMYIYAQTNEGGRSDTVSHDFTYGALPPSVSTSTIQISGNTVSFVAYWTTTKPDWFSWYLDSSTTTNKVFVGTNVSGSTFTFNLPDMALGNYTLNIQAETTIGFDSEYTSKNFNYGSVPDPVTAITLNSATKMVSFISPNWTPLNKPSSFYWYINDSLGTTVANSSANGILVGAKSPGSSFEFLFSNSTGGNYTIYIEARNIMGNTLASNAVVFYTAPQSPTTVRFTVPNTLSFYVDWNPWDTPTSFSYIIKNNDGTTKYIKSFDNVSTSGQLQSVTLTDITPLAVYTGTVYATNAYGSSGNVVIGDTTLTANPTIVNGSAPDSVTDIALNSVTKQVSFIVPTPTVFNRASIFDWSITNSSGVVASANGISLDTTASGGTYSFPVTITVGATYTVSITTKNAAGSTTASNDVMLYVTPNTPTNVLFTSPDQLSFYSSWTGEWDKPTSFSYTITRVSNTRDRLGRVIKSNIFVKEVVINNTSNLTLTSGQIFTESLTGLNIGTTTYEGSVNATNTYLTSSNVDITRSPNGTSFTYGTLPDQVTDITVDSATKTFSFTSPMWLDKNKPSSFTWYIQTNGVTVYSSSAYISITTELPGSIFGPFSIGTGGDYTIFVKLKNSKGESTYSKYLPFYSSPHDPYNNGFSTPNTVMSYYANWTPWNMPRSFRLSIFNADKSLNYTDTINNQIATTTTPGEIFMQTLRTSLIPGASYTGTINAVNTWGTSGALTIPSFFYGSKPSDPYTVRVVRQSYTATNVLLIFNHSYTTQTTPTKFSININWVSTFPNRYRQTTITTIKPSGSRYVVSYLNPSNGYFFRVNAANGVGISNIITTPTYSSDTLPLDTTNYGTPDITFS
jgi:hypothetical protein